MTHSILKHFWWDIKKRQYWFDVLLTLFDIFPGISGDLLRGLIWQQNVKSAGINIRVRRRCSLTNPQKFSCGDNLSLNVGCYLDAGGEIIIGDNVLIAPGVKIWSVSHNSNSLSPINLQEKSYGTIKIGNGVWIGANTVILPSVIIPEGVIVGSSSFIPANTKLEKFAVYAGIPAKKIKQRKAFDE